MCIRDSSDTDGDGDVRDFDEVEVGDKVSLTSVDGSGEYTIVTISDVTGYRELVVSTESASGTIADDTPVSIVLDVASSGATGGGIEEAPEDGKQYARQDGDWSEVEATSGGGGDVEAQPPVAFKLSNSISKNNLVPNASPVEAEFDTAIYDSESGADLSNNAYIVQKSGLYNLAYNLIGTSLLDKIWNLNLRLYRKKKGESTSTIVTTFSENHGADSGRAGLTVTGTFLIELEKDTELTFKINSGADAHTDGELYYSGLSFSGHMVSSFTEGEVKEKEAVVMSARLTTNQTVTANDYELIKLDGVEHDDNSYYDTATGRFNPKVAGYYQVNHSVQAKDTIAVGTTSISRIIKNKDSLAIGPDNIYDGSYIRSTASDQMTNPISTGSHIIYMNGDDDYLELWGRNSEGTEILAVYRNTSFSAHLITGQSTGGGSGGGDYTPEKMVWEDKKAERELGKIYKNDNDVPLYVQIYTYANGSGKNAQMWIDGKYFGAMGNSSGSTEGLNTNLFVIPANSEYELRAGTNAPELKEWHEARMPVAVGTGGKTVAFRGELSANQTITKSTVHKINLSEASVDTDNALVDGKFKPSVAGYYQVSGSVFSASTDTAVQTVSYLHKNGTLITHGNSVRTTDGTVTGVVSSSVIIDVVYLNGTTDYLELHGFIDTAGTPIVDSNKVHTYLSAVLVSGGSASGDSIVTQEGTEVTVGDDDVTKTTLKGNIEYTAIKDYVALDNETRIYGRFYGETGGGAIYDSFAHTFRTGQKNGEVLVIEPNGHVKFKGLGSYADLTDTEFRIYSKAGVGGTYDGFNHLFRTKTGGESFQINYNGHVYYYNAPTTPSAPNMHLSESDGMIRRSTASTYTAEEVDKKLAIKDKLIEKLSDRLDKLEKKLK